MDLQIVSIINQSLDTAIQASTQEELKLKLTTHINDLLLHDFEKLISILYRIDVSENKLRNMLSVHHTEDAAKIIAALIIERQLQKIESRKNNSRNQHIPEDEKW